jgi:tRNA(Ile)-lysidine synthase
MTRRRKDVRARRPVLLRRLGEAVRELALGGRRVAVAVSGGVDSMALLHGLAELAPRHALSLSVVHVNHGLRGAESAADEVLVRERASALGLAVAVAQVDVRAAVAAASSSRTRPTVQEAARRLRREALDELARKLGADHVATAHSADDQAETVLLRLLRGTGPSGLAGIPRQGEGGRLVRPLLRVSRAEVLAYARARKLVWREDRSNADPHYARSRLRGEWLPALRDAFNPRLLRALGDLAEAMGEESAWIERQLEGEARRRFRAAEDATWIEAKDWDVEVLPDALARRLARRLLHEEGAGRDVSRAHLDRIVTFLRDGRSGRCLELPGGLRLLRDARGLRLVRVALPSGPAC